MSAQVLRFTKRPVTVEAFRLGIDQWPLWFQEAVIKGRNLDAGDGAVKVFFVEHSGDISYASLRTLEGWLTVKRGDWIVRGIKDELYPVRPDIFDMTYEIAKEA